MRLPTSFDRKTLVALLAGVLAALVLNLLRLQAVVPVRADLQQLQHAHRVQGALDTVLDTLLEMQAGQRGYLLTLDRADLGPYLAAERRLGGALDALDAADAESDADLRELRRLALAARDALAEGVERAGAEGRDAAVRATLSPSGGAAELASLRSFAAGIDAGLAQQLADHRAAVGERLAAHTRWAVALTVLLALLLLAIHRLLRREQLARQQAAQAERAQNDELASRVAERTRLLEASMSAQALSEARLRAIFDSASDAILIVDEAQHVVMANAAAGRCFGYPSGTLLGMPLDRLLPARHRAQHRGDVQAFADSATRDARKMGRRADVTGLRADGSEFPIEAAISCVRDGGRPLFTVVLRDISERRRAEAELRAGEARWRRLLDLLPDAVFVNRGGRIAYLNDAALRLFGTEAFEVLGRSPLTLFHPDSVPLVRERMAELWAGRAVPAQAPLRLRRPDGQTREVESTATLVEQDGESAIVVVLRDVSELRRMRADLAASHADLRRLLAAQAEVQERERGRIAHELHDDLQQTLAAIKMDLAAIESLPDGPGESSRLAASARRMTDAALDSTRRIVNDLRPQMLDDLGLVPALQAMALGFSRRTGIAAEVLADEPDGPLPPLPAPVLTALFRIAQEALNNVAKHSGARQVSISLSLPSPGRLQLRIDDDGRGIDAPAGRRPGAYGLLGMRERMRALDGTLSVREAPGGGTCIEAELPISAPADTTPALGPPADAARTDPSPADTPR